MGRNKVISNEYKCIHVHIPRTAGSSIEDVFSNSGRADHRSIHDYRKQCVRHSKFEKYFKFTFVRNPWSKMVSHFIRYCISERSSKGIFESSYQSEFKDWIGHLPKIGAPKFDKTSNQLGWLCNKKWKDNVAPRNFKIDVDFVGRFENLEEDWDFISQKINLNSKLSHCRPGILNDENLYPDDYREYYDDETIEIVCQRYKDDINFFNYEFE
jgi:hypothetical protein